MVLIDGVWGILTDAGVEDTTVQQILTTLEDARTTVKAGERIELTPASSYGGAPTAAELGVHAGKAHHHVVEAMAQMVKGLGLYYENVEHLRKDVHRTDEDQAGEYARRVQRANDVQTQPLLDMGNACTTPTDFSSNTSCEVPAGGSDR